MSTRDTGGRETYVLQVHPTRTCNLLCRHCYSNSGPSVSGSLSSGRLNQYIEFAAGLGYSVLSVSGGEPLLYADLPVILAHARRLGMRTLVTSNGTLLTRRKLESLKAELDLLAISLDGAPESHDRMRGEQGAFKRMASKLAGLRESGIPFGFIFTLTQHNLDEVEWVTEFAVREGAALLQMHPLEAAGRAVSTLPDSVPDHVELEYAVVEVERLRDIYGHLIALRLDVFDRATLAESPAYFLANDAPADNALSRFAACVPTLVVESEGDIVPIMHGFPRRFRVGSIFDEDFNGSALKWLHDTYPAFHDHCKSVYRKLHTQDEMFVFNWFEHLTVE